MGLFEFCRVPFGMKNSGACFVRAITEILRPLSNVAKSLSMTLRYIQEVG